MKLINKGSDFAPAPAGLHRGVLVDVVDLGMMPGVNGPRPKINLCFELSETRMQDGRPFIVFRRFTASLAETAHLAQFLAKWRGGVPIKEGEAIEMEDLIGKSALLVIVHATKDQKTYANIDSILPCAEQVRPSGHYKRKDPGAQQSGSAVKQPVPPPVQQSTDTAMAGRTAFPFTAPYVPPPATGPLPTTAELAPRLATEEQRAKFLKVLEPLHENAAKYFYALGAIGKDQPLEELPLPYCPATKTQFDNVMGSIQAFIDAQAPITKEDDVPF